MMRYVLLFVFLLPLLAVAQKNKYGLNPTGLEAYKVSVKENSAKELIDLEKLIPGLVLDIRYATTNNFTGERIYTLAKAYARKPVAEALKRAQAALKDKGLGIKVFDAYRPYKATVKFYEVYHDTTYVASPYKGSRHNRGCAIDMTLIDLKTGQELKMPTGYDSFQKAAWPTTPVKDPEVRKNRALIIEVMKQQGFKVNGSEWWHFDFIGWTKYDVLDIDFEELQ
ncbi:M15 family metallopeptidase [Fulvivirgaceae bacterium PWU5]|uniref:D-alanyl-D-alanine dipeptidase n=1 Tax=Dawidia cretensis TaxID=2782350 RepID=A0AAP2DYX2_9BACT|nr:M15 family metallopeptidase [Dawidia cretensis]MBT1709928.1 M15 family metallopeptidase [Dawidia cretensis]